MDLPLDSNFFGQCQGFDAVMRTFRTVAARLSSDGSLSKPLAIKISSE